MCLLFASVKQAARCIYASFFFLVTLLFLSVRRQHVRRLRRKKERKNDEERTLQARSVTDEANDAPQMDTPQHEFVALDIDGIVFDRCQCAG